MNILVTGASGLVGSALSRRFTAQGHTVIALRRRQAPGIGPSWNPDENHVDLGRATSIDAVIHLAGENIAQRWTPGAMQRIRSSRVNATRLLCEAIAAHASPPRVLLCASATGFYGSRGDEVLDEQSRPGVGFLPEICQSWEAAAAPARQRGIRVVSLRLGIVLSRRGGALAKMLPVFRLGLGGKVGSGRQYWSWVSLEDALRAAEFCLGNDQLDGPVNVVSPGPCTNADFTQALGAALKLPAMLPAPAFALRAVFGEMADATLLASTRVLPRRLTEAGFRFNHAEIRQALREVLRPEAS